MESHEKDYYSILQVHPDAEPEVIKAVYRRLSQKYHPDGSEPDEERMKEINEAYGVLDDPEERARYDEWYAAAPEAEWEEPYDSAPAYYDAPSGGSVISLTNVLLVFGLIVLIILDVFLGPVPIPLIPDLTISGVAIYLIARYLLKHGGPFRPI